MPLWPDKVNMLFLFVQFLLYCPATGQTDKAFAPLIAHLRKLVAGKLNTTPIQPPALSARQRIRYAYWQYDPHKLRYQTLFGLFVMSALPIDWKNQVKNGSIRLPLITKAI